MLVLAEVISRAWMALSHQVTFMIEAHSVDYIIFLIHIKKSCKSPKANPEPDGTYQF